MTGSVPEEAVAEAFAEQRGSSPSRRRLRLRGVVGRGSESPVVATRGMRH